MKIEDKRLSFSELPDILKPVEIADYLGFSKSAVYNLLHQNLIPYRRIGTRYLIAKHALASFFDMPSLAVEVH